MKIDFQAFVGSLGYMLKGMAGIFIVTLLIIAAVMILEKCTGKKEE